TDRAGDRFGEYSLGMKQRLGIAAALLCDPALLILDEPTNGLDPAGVSDMRDLLSRPPAEDDEMLRLADIVSAAGLVAGRHGDHLVVSVNGHDPKDVAVSLNRASASAGIVL